MSSLEQIVPEGYKQTEVGVIPKEWSAKELGEVCSLKSGLGITAKDIDLNSNFPCYGGNGLRGYTKTFTHEGDYALIGRQGALCGNVQFANGKFFASEHALVATPNKDNDAKWLSIYLERMNLNQYSESSAQPGLSAEKLKVLKLITPLSKEQTAIANALSDVDVLLSELEHLIAKKQAIKTATMQQLLTGKTRLPQFAFYSDINSTEDAVESKRKGIKPSELGEIPEDWDVVTIGDFAPLQRGFDLTHSNRRDGVYPIVYSNGIANYHSQFQVKGPGVVTGRSGTLGKVHYIDENYWPHNTSLWVTKFEIAHPKYVYYLYKHVGFERFASGSGVPTLNRNDAHDFKITVPPTKEEQTAIATILSDMDNEIQILEQRLSKTRQIKQGMMQELLTGKTRLPFDKN